MVPENKQNRIYKLINFIGIQNNRHPSQHTAGARSGEYRGWTSLFPRQKSIMKDARFADVAAIQERVTAVLRSITKQAFADSFQTLYERCQQCVVKDGDYFEGQ
jgi:hypothetical protein